MSIGNGFTPLVRTLTESKDVLADIADAGLEAAEKIPVFGWAVKAWNVKNTFQAKKLYRNTEIFLSSSSISDAQKFIDRFSSEDEKSELCDSVIQVLIDSEKPYKAKLTSQLLNSIYEGKIAVADANKLILIILNASIPALEALESFFQSCITGHSSSISQESRTYAPLLMSMGVIYVDETSARISDLGRLLHQHAFIGVRYR